MPWGSPNVNRNRTYESNAADLREQLKRVNAELVQVRKQVAVLENERQGLSNAIAALDGIKLGSLPISATSATPAGMTRLQISTNETVRMWGTLLDQLDRRIGRGETFYKPQPAVYGLREWESKTETA